MQQQTQVDFSELEYAGRDESTYSIEPVYLFRRSLHQPREYSILSSREPVSIPEPQFNAQMRELEGRIREIEESWKYNKIINFDDTELKGLKTQYAEMQRLREEILMQSN